MWSKVIDQVFSQLGVHFGIAIFDLISCFSGYLVFLVFFVRIDCTAWHAEEFQCLFHGLRRLVVQVFASEDQKLFFGVRLHPVLQLVYINATSKVGERPVGRTGVVLVCQYFLTLTGDSLWFGLNGLFK